MENPICRDKAIFHKTSEENLTLETFFCLKSKCSLNFFFHTVYTNECILAIIFNAKGINSGNSA